MNQSAATVQVSAAEANPSIAANAPVNGNVPVCVASTCNGGNASQGPGASTNAASTGAGGTGQESTDQSIGSAQAGAVSVNPAAAANAPVNAQRSGVRREHL